MLVVLTIKVNLFSKEMHCNKLNCTIKFKHLTLAKSPPKKRKKMEPNSGTSLVRNETLSSCSFSRHSKLSTQFFILLLLNLNWDVCARTGTYSYANCNLQCPRKNRTLEQKDANKNKTVETRVFKSFQRIITIKNRLK